MFSCYDAADRPLYVAQFVIGAPNTTAQLHRCHALRVYKKRHRSFEQVDRVNVDTALSHIAAPWKAARDGQDRDSHWLWHDIRKAVDSLVMRLKGAAPFS